MCVAANEGLRVRIGPQRFHCKLLLRRKQGAEAGRGGLAYAALRDEAGNQPRRRNVKCGVGGRRTGRRNIDYCDRAIRQPAGDLRYLGRGPFLDRDHVAGPQTPVDRA